MHRTSPYPPASMRNPITLWVEDNFTRQYLYKIWQDEESLFNILIGGGKETVKGIVHDQRALGVENVFGIIDRDFSPTNQERWDQENSGIEIFLPEAHEIENYLLDWRAMEGCRANKALHNREAGDIRERAVGFAQTMLWWMACRSVRVNYRDRVVSNYPKDPGIRDIASLEQAEEYIARTRWYGELSANVAHILDPENVKQDLSDAHEIHLRELNDNAWPRTFSGKEIFRNLRGWIYDTTAGTKTEKDEDFGKSIGDWQFGNSQIPEPLMKLKNTIKQRVGL